MADVQAQFRCMDITASSPSYQPHHDYKPEVKEFGRKSGVKIEDDLAEYSKLALEYYNSKHKSQYVLVDLLYLKCVTSWKDLNPGYLHMSFTARSKDSPHIVRLFFAEVYSHETEESFIPYVKSCTPVDPGTPFCSTGCGVCRPDAVIYHPMGKYIMGGSSYSSPFSTLLDPAEESAKKLLREKYICMASIQDLTPEEDGELRQIMNCYAMDSISSYETRTNCHVSLVKVVAAVRFSDCLARWWKDGRKWVHLLFLAQTAPHQVEFFFAEVSIDCRWVTTCVSLSRFDNSGLKSEANTDCRLCRDNCSMLSHPEGGYVAGIDGGTFVDALDINRSWRLKVNLEESSCKA